MLRILRIVSEIPAMFRFRVWISSSGRSRVLPEGSPMRPVAPPTRTTAEWPQRRNQERTMIPIRLPRWRVSAVGSKPQYTRRDESEQTERRFSLVRDSSKPLSSRISTTLERFR